MEILTMISGVAVNAIHMAAGAIDLSTVDFTPMVTMIEGAVPAVLSATIPVTGIRKVLSFVMGSIKGC
ncbi:MAG: hypothetical protein J6A37_16570 [Oscillospiraceae bacterium]|nr:hypothetical protein [Oscillospiraceae bacterium]